MPFSPSFTTFSPEAFLHQSVFVVLAEEHGLAMFQIDGVFGAVFFLGNGVVRAVIEDDAVLENLADAGSFVVVGGFQDFHRSGCIRGNGACKKWPRAPKQSSAGWNGSSTVP